LTDSALATPRAAHAIAASIVIVDRVEPLVQVADEVQHIFERQNPLCRRRVRCAKLGRW
jgi:hypothetical protein